MEKRIVCRGLEKTTAIENHIEKHIKKIESLLAKERQPVSMTITLEVHKPSDQKTTIHIITPVYEIYTTTTTDDIFTSITQTLELAHEKINQNNDKHHKKHGCDGECRAKRFGELEKDIAFEKQEPK